MDKFDRILSSVIDSHLGLRSRLIDYLENRDGNANVRFMQAETHRRFFEMMRSFGIHVRSFRADCGSYSEDIVKMVMEHTDKFYIRAERHAGLYEKVKRLTGWTTVEIGFQQYDVQSFPFESFEDVKHCRLVVQRQRKQKGEQLDIFDGEYTYRCILTNDWDMTDEEIILHYNKRGSAEHTKTYLLCTTKSGKNAFAADITPPRRLRRWTAAFFGVIAAGRNIEEQE